MVRHGIRGSRHCNGDVQQNRDGELEAHVRYTDSKHSRREVERDWRGLASELWARRFESSETMADALARKARGARTLGV
jgi:hypothetical protein